MKKTACLILAVLMSCLLVLPVMAASAEPVITLQPQNYNYPEYSVAIYTVKAEGSNLQATWYMDWNGKIYTISDIGGAIEEWEGYAGEAYGARKLDDNTFIFVFEGIGRELDGGYIWCVIEDGHGSATSQKARITISDSKMPPEIVSIPTQLTVNLGEPAQIRCVAKSPDGSQLSFLWYETDTGRLEDIRAVNRGTENADYLLCDTSEVGTRNYICMIESANGGMTYSSVVSVTVVEKQPEPTQPEPTQPAPQPTVSTDNNAETPTNANPSDDQPKEDSSWLGFAIVAVIAAGVGFGAAVIFVRKKK